MTLEDRIKKLEIQSLCTMDKLNQLGKRLAMVYLELGGGFCHCGDPLPIAKDNETPFEFCSEECDFNKWGVK